MRRLLTLLTVLALAAMTLTACKGQRAEGEALKPKVAPPVIASAGVLAVGIDPSIPPFAGKVDGQTVGLDVDVAAALAERLGLELKLVEIEPAEIPEALRGRKIDVALGALPITSEVLAETGFAGSYVVDAPAFFASSDESVTVGTLGGRKVGAQEGSVAYWRLESDLGPGVVQTYATLREAFDALKAGEIDVVAGDAIVGAYLTRDFEGIRFAGQIRPGTPLGVVVPQEAPELEPAVRESLDEMAAQGVLDTIMRKWTGGMPELVVETSGTAQ